MAQYGKISFRIKQRVLQFILRNKSVLAFGFATSVLFLIMMLVEQANGRFWLNDFKVFYSAAQALISNEQVYGVAFGLDTGFYKYSPFTLLLFTPYTLLSYPLASSVHFWVIVVFSISLIILLTSFLTKNLFGQTKKAIFIYFAILICILNHLIRELHLGNTNIILLFILTLGLYYSIKKKSIYAGLFLGVAILTKPYFLILALPFILYKKWNIILSTGIAILGYIILSILIFGYNEGINLYQDWIISMSNHSGYITSSNTILSILDTYLSVSLPSYVGFVLLGLFSLLLFIMFLIRKLDATKGLILFFFLLIASIPNFLITDTEHFLFLIPIILTILNYLILNEKYIGIIPFIGLIFLYGGNSSDFLGSDLSTSFYNYGVLGISNILLILWVLFIIFQKSNPLCIEKTVEST